MENHNEHRPPGMARINIDNEDELLQWVVRLGCTPDQLRTAVRSVGPGVDEVLEYLRQLNAT